MNQLKTRQLYSFEQQVPFCVVSQQGADMRCGKLEETGARLEMSSTDTFVSRCTANRLVTVMLSQRNTTILKHLRPCKAVVLHRSNVDGTFKG